MCRVGVVLFVVSCVTLYLSVFLVDVDAKSVVAITSPSNLKQTITQHTPAVFGNPKYGSYVNGILFYPTDPSNRLACVQINTSKEKDLPTKSGSGVPVIWMVDRSPDIDDPDTEWNDVCSFVTKVRYAQQAGAVAVVVVNRQKQKDGQPVDEDLVYMADDGSGGDVSSPAVMIQKSAAQVLIDAMREVLPTKKFIKISMQISWSIPTDDGFVNWDLWTSSWDTQSVSLKRIFGGADLALHDNTLFTPHYFYYAGDNFAGDNCTAQIDHCGTNCVANGQYCQQDPDGDDTNSFTGADIVKENLWQSCVWKYLDEASKADDGKAHMIRNKWWHYVADFQDKCNTAANWRSETCRDGIMDTYAIDKSAVKTCYQVCDLSPTSAGECAMIKKDINDRITGSGIFYLPTLVINGEAIRGSISCYPPISTSSCNVMSYICQGYSSSTRPPVCTNSADGCNFWERRDCGGVCGGSSSVDRCGLCLGPDDGSRDKTCRDCNNEIFGNHTLDACGVCLEKTDVSRNSTCKDCLGVVHGTAEKDACGICQGDGKSCSKLSTGAIIAIVLAISGVVGGAIYLYMRRQQNRMRDDIDGILKQYLPLDGSAGGAGGGGGSGHIRPTQRLDGHDNL